MEYCLFQLVCFFSRSIINVHHPSIIQANCPHANSPPDQQSSTFISHVRHATLTPVETAQEDCIYHQHPIQTPQRVPQQLLNQINMRQHHSPTTIPLQAQLIERFSVKLAPRKERVKIPFRVFLNV